MIDTLLVATQNHNKLREIKQIFSESPLSIIGIDDLDVAIPEIIEDGRTFAENARKKAVTIARISALHTIADDSGLCVDALDGQPGVFSARYAGTNNDADNIELLLKKLSGVDLESRTAHFVCAIAFASPHQHIETVEARCEGLISMNSCGKGGFGYDPVFFVPALKRTFAEISQEEKNALSHRFKALTLIRPIIEKYVPKSEK